MGVRNRGNLVNIATRPSETPPEAPSPQRPRATIADAHSGGQESTQSRPEPQRAPRPRRGRRTRDLARSEYVGNALRLDGPDDFTEFPRILAPGNALRTDHPGDRASKRLVECQVPCDPLRELT